MTVGPGAEVDAADIAALVAGQLVTEVVTTATVGTVASGFTVNDVRAATMLGGHLVDLDLYLLTTAAITATAGNIADTTCFTLAAAYRPTHTLSAVFGNGSMTGEASIAPTGIVSLRGASDTIATATNIRLHATYTIT